MLYQLSYSRNELDIVPSSAATELLPHRSTNVIRRPEIHQSHRSDLNRRPLDYESSALPLSYGGSLQWSRGESNP